MKLFKYIVPLKYWKFLMEIWKAYFPFRKHLPWLKLLQSPLFSTLECLTIKDEALIMWRWKSNTVSIFLPIPHESFTSFSVSRRIIFISKVDNLKGTFIWWLNHLREYAQFIKVKLSLIFVSSRFRYSLSNSASLPTCESQIAVLHASWNPKIITCHLSQKPSTFQSLNHLGYLFQNSPFLKVCTVSTQKENCFLECFRGALYGFILSLPS